jgi:hypothetical protein
VLPSIGKSILEGGSGMAHRKKFGNSVLPSVALEREASDLQEGGQPALAQETAMAGSTPPSTGEDYAPSPLEIYGNYGSMIGQRWFFIVINDLNSPGLSATERPRGAFEIAPQRRLA